ncbi:MAG: hypothetical protein ACFB21_00175 [Opitutales bacterium]
MQTDSPAADAPSFQDLKAALAAQPLFEDKTWRLSPEPWWITPELEVELEAIGRACHAFYQGVEQLYRRSWEGKNLLRNRDLYAPWIADYLDRGKPLRIIEHGRIKRLKGVVPTVIRPDLLLCEDGFALTELDSVPGGLGLTAFLNRLYAPSAPSVIDGDAHGAQLLDVFYRAVAAHAPEVDDPLICVVLSDEAAVYRPEYDYLARQLRERGHRVYVRHPDQLMPMAGALSIPVNGSPETVDIIYRFWELFDTGNIRTAQAICEAVENGEVACTPPMKAYQEEKLNLALLHHHLLEDFWRENLGRQDSKVLRKLVPKSWVVDPVELPPNAVLDAPTVNGKPIRRWEELGEASQKERNLILKASGFHETAWGARSVVYGSDHSREEWLDALENATDMAGETLHILQEYRKPQRLKHPVYTEDGERVEMEGRLRLCPFYLVEGEDVQLAGALATFCPADKKIIHGMKDAAMLPTAVRR